MAYLKSLKSQFRFVCPHFGPINSNCALRYCYAKRKNANTVEKLMNE